MRRASGWSPAVTSSPLISTRLRPPGAAAPSRSAGSASRFRSRTVSCMIGSRPFSTRRWAAASDDMCTCAPVLSVQLIASTDPRSTSARRQVACGSALLLEDNSAVTTKWPSRNRPARRLGLVMGLPALRRHPVATPQEIDPGWGSLQLPIHRLLHVLHVIPEDRQSPRSLPRFHPNAGLIREDLAIAVRPHAATGPVAEILGTAHRTAQAGRMQDALAAHLAAPDCLLERLFHGEDEPFGNRHEPQPFFRVLSISSTAWVSAWFSAASAAPTICLAIRAAIEASGAQWSAPESLADSSATGAPPTITATLPRN